jgi:MoaA/NifB/PqqE/SkfB family radical SAM enzyme
MKQVQEIYIEISGKCNAHCPFCARQRFDKRFNGKTMSADFFEKIINHIQKIGLLQVDKKNEKKKSISLHNWGEPFLNTELNSILKVLDKNGLQADVSSTFIVKPKLDNVNLRVLRKVYFSLSGFTQESYEKIHGFDLNRVLENFEDFYKNIRKFSPDTIILIAWHRYKFNESELWNAYNYFNRPGIIFSPVLAYINDLSEMLSYVNGEMTDERRKQVGQDMYLDRLNNLYQKRNNYVNQAEIAKINNNLSGLEAAKVSEVPIKLYGALAKIEDNFKITNTNSDDSRLHCHMWTQLVVDEIGQVLLCCGMTSEDKGQIVGNILELNAETFWSKRTGDQFCKTCFTTEEFLQITDHNNPLPFTWNLVKYLSLWYKIKFPGGVARYTLFLLARFVKLFPNGKHAVNYVKRVIKYN